MSIEGGKVYFPVESLMGLGHLNRTGKLVREMVKAGLEVTVASGSFVDPKRFFAGAKLREIPPIVIKGRDVFFTLNADGSRTIMPDFNQAARKDERKNAHLKNIASVKPDVLVSEFWPFNRAQVDDEMGAMLEKTKASGDHVLKIASVRDVLDPPSEKGPEAEAKVREREAFAVKTINENFDAVLVHGDPNFIPLSETFSAADKLKVPVIYTGYVVDNMPKRTVKADDPNAPVLVSCGAGADCHELIFSFLTAWQKLLERRDADPAAAKLVNRPVHIITGPRFEPNTFQEVKDWAKIVEQESGFPVKVENYREDFTSLLANAAFSVSFAGYNTTLETLATGVPHVMVPNYAYYHGHMKMNTEQIYRLQRLQEKGYAAYAHPKDVQNGKKFAEILVNEFTRQTAGNHERPQLNFEGAANTISTLTQLLQKKHSPAA
ncbi:MAG: glycosyltransferase family protein [Alphaproteobacteria bacterium]